MALSLPLRFRFLADGSHTVCCNAADLRLHELMLCRSLGDDQEHGIKQRQIRHGLGGAAGAGARRAGRAGQPPGNSGAA